MDKVALALQIANQFWTLIEQMATDAQAAGDPTTPEIQQQMADSKAAHDRITTIINPPPTPTT